MRIVFMLMFVFLGTLQTAAQVTETTTTITEQQLENITENNEDLETEDDSYLQQMIQYIKNPVNLNTADAAELNLLRVLTPIQVQNFILYRNLVGKLVDLYELQAVPGWDIRTIQKIRQYISVSLQVSIANTFGNRMRGGDHSILIRASQVPERSKGYLIDSSTSTNFYPGSPQKLLFLYKYVYKNLFSMVLLERKMPANSFLKENKSWVLIFIRLIFL
jgi:hypothetical protein